MSTVNNKGVEIHCKAVTTQVFTVVGLIVELGLAIVKLKFSIEASTTIRKPCVTVTSNSPDIYSSILS